MSRIVNTETPGKKREHLLFFIYDAINQLNNSSNWEFKDKNDLIAFILLSLDEVEKTLTQTIQSWEKRDYWSKADEFHQEWKWVSVMKCSIKDEMTSTGWDKPPLSLDFIFRKIQFMGISGKLKRRDYWRNAYSILKSK